MLMEGVSGVSVPDVLSKQPAEGATDLFLCNNGK